MLAGDAEVREAQHLLVDHADAVLDAPRAGSRTRTAGRASGSRRVGPDDAGEDLEQRGLAGAVLADQRVRFALGDVEADAAQRVHGAKRFLNAVELQTHAARW